MTNAIDYDAELRLYQEILQPAWGVGPADHVVDIGCGTGQTTRQAARLAVAGDALGVDVSEPSVAEARRLARQQGPRNVAFECADAAVHRFPDRRFDLAISRFGTMFFGDPGAAFVNIARALRPDGRLVMLVWQAREHNEWALAIERALAVPASSVDSGGMDPFSLADQTTVTPMLRAAGFVDVTFTAVRKPVFYGPDTEAALAMAAGFSTTKQALRQLEPPAAEQALGRLRRTMADHLGAGGVWFDSSAWIVAARRGRPPG